MFESKEDKALRAKIAAEEKEKFDKEAQARKEAAMRAQERAKLESGGLSGVLKDLFRKSMKALDEEN